ncbi:MAG: hypothetical protein BroJett011_62940 [Chloroflexota bacterium]|nr:MAG: hypothetical protein BroJett011_62940 [Chloroflexota bacterium]
MNTVNEWLTTATVTNPERAAEWQNLFGSNVVPITSIIPLVGKFPGGVEALYYPLDLKAIGPERKEKLIASIARQFNLAPEEVRAEIDRIGVPVLAADVMVSSRDSGLNYSSILFMEDDRIADEWEDDDDEEWYDDEL